MRPLALVLLAALGVGGCAPDGDPQPAATGAAVDGVVELVGNDQLQFVPSEVTADAGEVTIELTCQGSAPHTIVIVETGEVVAECTGNATGEGEVTLDPGRYEFFCSIPGHRRAGMDGVLTVGS